MNYIGKVTTEVIEELREKLGYTGNYAPCSYLYYDKNYNKDIEFKIKLTGFYMRNDVSLGSGNKHPMIPQFEKLSEKEYIEYINSKNIDISIIDDFQSVEKWIELYNLEIEKFIKR